MKRKKIKIKKKTDRVQVLHDVLEGGVRPELLKELPLVEQRVHQVGVVVERVAQAGVDDLQHHADHLLNHVQVLGLQGGRGREDVKVNWFPTTLLPHVTTVFISPFF